MFKKIGLVVTGVVAALALAGPAAVHSDSAGSVTGNSGRCSQNAVHGNENGDSQGTGGCDKVGFSW